MLFLYLVLRFCYEKINKSNILFVFNLRKCFSQSSLTNGTRFPPRQQLINKKIPSLVAPAHIFKINKLLELWRTEFRELQVKKRLSFGSFGFCRELIQMRGELRSFH